MATPFIGEITMFGGNFAPRGWALCDGQLLAISQNNALFSLFGTIYGGDGRTTFGLPDLRGRVPLHQGNGPGLSPRQLGQKSGQEDVTLSVNQIPSHGHAGDVGVSAVDLPATSTDPAGRAYAIPTDGHAAYADAATGNFVGSSASTNTGGTRDHTNLQPFVCVNFIVALQGVYPSRS